VRLSSVDLYLVDVKLYLQKTFYNLQDTVHLEVFLDFKNSYGYLGDAGPSIHGVC